MKTLLLSIIAFTIFEAACKKSDRTGSEGGSWTEDNESYVPQTVEGVIVDTNYQLTAKYVNGEYKNSILFLFNGTSTPAAGIYKVVSRLPSAHEVSFYISWGVLSSPHYWFYSSAGYDSVRVTVTVDQGRVSISMPDALAIDFADHDTMKVTANIRQTN